MLNFNSKLPTDIKIGNKTVETIWMRNEVVWGRVQEMFYIENTYNGSNRVDILVSLNNPTNSHITELQYSTDKLNWTTYQLSNGSTSITLSEGQRVYFRNDSGYCNTYVSDSNYWVMTFNPSESYIVGGNINSLLDYTDMYNVTLPNYCYYKLFINSSTLTSAADLTLVSSTASEGCYRAMFFQCTSLVTPPSINATTLSEYCCYSMFANCTSLTTAPELPATTLASACYYNMFNGCSSLTTAPELPATTLADYCYYNMFYGCSSLTTAPELPATTLVNSCYENMFNRCTSLTTVPALLATTLASRCCYQMFINCSSLTTAPELPATTLASYCYYAMFANCTSLTTAPSLPATTLATYCYQYMFYICTSLTTAPELPATTLMQNCYQYMFRGCTSLNKVTTYANDISASNCIDNWLQDVAPTGTFYNNGTATYTIDSPSGIPVGWTEVSMGYTKLEYITNIYPSGYSGNTDVVAGIRFPVQYTTNFVIDCEVIGGTPLYGDYDCLFDLFYVYYDSTDRRYYYKSLSGIHTNTGEPTYNSHILDNRMTTNISNTTYAANTNYSIHCPMSTSYVNNQVLYNGSAKSTSHTVYLDILQFSIYNPSNGKVFFAKNTTQWRRGSTYKLKSMKIWDGNTLLYDFIPVKRTSDNEICLFDKVSHTFFTKSSECTLSFIAGPEVTE